MATVRATVPAWAPMTRAALLRAAYGLALLGAPGRALRTVAGQAPNRATTTVVRVLGVRDIAQSLACAGSPTRPVLGIGAGIDAVHALSMLALAAGVRSWRRGALVSAVVAGSFAAEEVWRGRRLPRHTTAFGADRAVARVFGARDAAAASLTRYVLPHPVSSRLFWTT